MTGNTVIDSLLWMRGKLRSDGVSASGVAARCSIPEDFSKKYLEGGAPWILVTGHRRENFGKGFENLCLALGTLSEKYPDAGILYPVHLNPNVQEPVRRLLSGRARIALIPPVGYEDFIWLMDRCAFAISDSGGVQEEAPSLGKPVISEASVLLSDPAEYARRSSLKNPYGDGRAAEKIREILEKSPCLRTL